MLTKHYFNEDGSHNSSVSIGSVKSSENLTCISNRMETYPFPIKLEEGVIVQDSGKQPYQGKWRNKADIKKMKARKDNKDAV